MQRGGGPPGGGPLGGLAQLGEAWSSEAELRWRRRELPIGVSRGQRIVAGVALVFALPIILFPAH